MQLSKVGIIAKDSWQSIPAHFQICEIDEFIVMPNHIHGIVIIKNIGKNVGNGNEDIRSLHSKRWSGAGSGSLSSVLRGFKIGVTKWCRKNGIDNFAWQKSFYDHIIRNEKSLNEIREYIKKNPHKWESDKNNPENLFI